MLPQPVLYAALLLIRHICDAHRKLSGHPSRGAMLSAEEHDQGGCCPVRTAQEHPRVSSSQESRVKSQDVPESLQLLPSRQRDLEPGDARPKDLQRALTRALPAVNGAAVNKPKCASAVRVSARTTGSESHSARHSGLHQAEQKAA